MKVEGNPEVHKGYQLRVHHVLDGQVLPQETMHILDKKVDPDGNESFVAAYSGHRHIQEIPVEALRDGGVYGCIVIDEVVSTDGAIKK